MPDSTAVDAFAAVADVLIPGSAEMPSATEAGVPGDLLDQVLRFRPDLVESFRTAVAACGGQHPEVALDELANDHPDQFAALTLLTAGAYFQSPLVKQALDYAPPPRMVHDDIDTYIDLLANVVDRGFAARADRGSGET